MNKLQLQEILSAPFNLDNWRNALAEIFNVKHFHRQPQPIILPANDKAESAYELGSFETEDDRLIGLYRVNVLPGVVLERNKVGLRALLRHVYQYDVDGALIVFVQGDKWRLSFVSEIRALDEYGNVSKIATEPKRYTYLLGRDEKTRTPVDRLYAIVDRPKTLEDIRNAFSVEALNEEFYKTVARYFYQLVGATAGKVKKAITYQRILELPGIDPTKNDARKLYQEFAVRLIGRIIFCWFLKMKKSDDGFPLLPEELLSSQSVRSNQYFYHTILERLFFQTLNTPMDERVPGLPKGCEITPFLNGGLFEPHPDDFYLPDNLTGFNKNLNTLRIPDDWFLEFFMELEKYNFTIDENSVVDIEVSVDPEMLGRIFENLLAEIDPDSGETARKATGSYYTPREIVDYMATESLLYYLNSKTAIEIDTLQPIFKMDEKVSFIRDDNEKILNALDKLTVLDPACGSGAFPIGVMQKIVMALQKLDPDSRWWKERQISRIENAILRKQIKEKLDTASVEYARKLGIIQNSLFGVDIQPIAAEISKLRCFLTLVVDETIDDTKPNRGVEALPNLEFKFVTADTLIPLPAATKKQGMGFLFDNQDELSELSRLRKQYLQSYGQEKEEIKTRFLQMQKNIFKQQIQSASGSDERALKISSWNPFDHSKTDWFDTDWMFGEKDFDVVIGNPPYIKEYTNRSAFDGKRNHTYYQGKMDIWYFFGSVSIDLLNENGIECFIAQNNWITSAGASKFRNKVLNETEILLFTDFADYKVFQAAGIQTMVYILIKKKPRTTYQLRYSRLSQNQINKEQLVSFLNFNIKHSNYFQKFLIELNPNELKNSYINFINPKINSILNIIKNKGILNLYEKEIIQGIVSPQDFLNYSGLTKLSAYNYQLGEGIFVLTTSELKKLNLNKDELELIKPYFTTEELTRYYGDANNKYWIIYSKSDIKHHINNYPNIKAHLDRFKKIITSDFGPYGLHRSRDESFFKEEKIISLRKCKIPTFTYTDFDCYVSQTFFVIKTARLNLKYLTALLNSKVVAFWLKYKGKLQGELYQIDKVPLLEIPLIESKYYHDLKVIVDYIIFLKSLGNEASINNYVSKEFIARQFEEIIDALVFELYFEEDFKKAGITFIPYVERDFPSLDGLSDEEKIETIRSVYQKLRQKDNEIMNNLKLMDIRLADLIGPIKAVG
ncbi:N-6 DNA methylase [candidate division KSB1 bacterium]|nr:N-6 DNA methylase [candidate division KSB1 bacterium]